MTRVPLDCGRTITTLSTSRERMFYYHKKKPGNPGRGNRASRRTLVAGPNLEGPRQVGRAVQTARDPCGNYHSEKGHRHVRSYCSQVAYGRISGAVGKPRGRHLSGAFLTKPNLRQLAPALLERGVSKRGPSPTLNRINSRQAPNEAGYIPGSGMTSMISIHAPGICR